MKAIHHINGDPLDNRPENLTVVDIRNVDLVERLRQAIVASGRSASAYAREVLIRSPRTVRRWLAGQSPIPQAVVEYLQHQQAPHA